MECGLAVVHPWLCDAMGHLSTRHYLGMFDDAAYQLFALIGYDAAAAEAEQWGWADVRHEIDYRSELAAGAVVRIDGRITAMGRSSITADYRLIDRSGDRVCALLTAKTVCFDLAARRSRPVPDAVREGAAARFTLDIPQA
jgi:acyl-CoA thioester hydrolase